MAKCWECIFEWRCDWRQIKDGVCQDYKQDTTEVKNAGKDIERNTESV